jgi:FAD-dependent urate hydroxylase
VFAYSFRELKSAIASLPVNRLRGYPGAYYNYPQLPDAARWFQAWRFNQVGSTPTPDAIERVIAFSNFHLYLSAPWKSAHNQGDRIVAQVNDDVFEFDFAIAGTGYFVDPTKRLELAEFAHHF